MPKFSLRVREMLIEDVKSLGSHKFFLARTVEDQNRADGLQLFSFTASIGHGDTSLAGRTLGPDCCEIE